MPVRRDAPIGAGPSSGADARWCCEAYGYGAGDAADTGFVQFDELSGGYRFIGEEGAASGAARTTMTVVRGGKTGGGGTDDGSKPSASAFDSYDDEDLTTGRDVNFLLSLDRPTTLGASLQITGESSRFTPEWVGPMLMAMWEEELSGAGGAGAGGGEVRAQVEG